MTELRLVQISLLVRDYDEAIQYYTNILGFQLVEDTILSATKRWVVVSPNSTHCTLLLAKAATPDQEKAIGNQSGGRVFLFLHTDRLQIQGKVRSPRIDNQIPIIPISIHFQSCFFQLSHWMV